MNIIIIGFMGTGKSTVGQLLAQRLGWEFMDVDAFIQLKQGKTISQIFQSQGEAYFRQLEAQLAKELASKERQVIATGGGFVLNPKNIAVFRPNGFVIALTATPERVYERVKNEGHRPLLAVADPLTRIKELLQERSASYCDADFVLDTSFSNPPQLVAEIIEELTRRGFYNGRSQAELS